MRNNETPVSSNTPKSHIKILAKCMKRYLEQQVKNDLKQKMVFLGGPRQVGKTTLAQLISPKKAYLNWDFASDREKILNSTLPNTKIWVFDEIHKYRKWRNFLKGLYDVHKDQVQILVTGSARLDLYRREGDSLQGRYHYLRLHPITIDELKVYNKKTIQDLFELGGFPEPFLRGNQIDAKRWSNQYRERILRDDIASIEVLQDIGTAEKCLLRLPELVSSTLSVNSLREDLQVDFKTVQRWLEIFENFYAIFRLTTFGSSQIKASIKAQKHYHFDWTLVKDKGARFENLIALHLLKWSHYFYDVYGRHLSIKFYKDREQREVDFVITEDDNPLIFIECKLANKEIGPALKYLCHKFPTSKFYQITYADVGDFITGEGIRVAPSHIALKEILTFLNNT